jgi:hypothetical protein
MSTKIFPLCLIALNLCAGIVYFYNGQIRMGVYWMAAATLNVCVMLGK